MNDFYVFDVHIDYFLLRRFHIDMHSRSVGNPCKKSVFAMYDSLMWTFIGNSRRSPVRLKDIWPTFINRKNFSSELQFPTFFVKYEF